MTQSPAARSVCARVSDHWPVIAATLVAGILLAPFVLNMGALIDDYVLLNALHKGKGPLEYAISELPRNARILECFAQQVEYRLFDLSPALAQLYALLLHLANGLLLYVLLLRMKIDRWMACAVVVVRLTFALQSEAIFWFAARLYLTSTALMTLSLLAVFSTRRASALTPWLVGIPLLAAVLLMEQVAPTAFMLGLALWWKWGRNEVRRDVLWTWFGAAALGAVAYLLARHFVDVGRAGELKSPLDMLYMLKATTLRWTGAGPLMKGLEVVQTQPWTLIPLAALAAIAGISCARSTVPDRSHLRRLALLSVLGVIGAVAPLLMVWVPSRIFYQPAAWFALGGVAIAIGLMRRPAWLLVVGWVAVSVVATLGNAQNFVESNRYQQGYFRAFKQAVPQLPESTRRILARGMPIWVGNVQVFDETWSMGEALTGMYDRVDRPVEAWTQERPCPWPADTVSFTAVWDPETRSISIRPGLDDTWQAAD